MTRVMRAHPRRGSVVIIVLWAIALAALVASSVQLFAFRQATMGHETLNRIQARWAARAGVESTIAMLGLHTESPIPEDALAIVYDLESVSSSTWAELHDVIYDIRYHASGRDWQGPMDEHSKANINRDIAAIGVFDDMTPDVIAAVMDWVDEDDEPSMLGAEREWYLSLSSPYEPRNGPLHDIAEMELIAGIWPDFLRGEDWNLNNRLDPNEDDGMRSVPEDEPDGILEPGWSGRLTTYSVDGGVTDSGLPRILLRHADIVDLMDRCGLDDAQAKALKTFGKDSNNTLEQLIITPLGQPAGTGGAAGGGAALGSAVPPLTDEQLRAVLAETTIIPAFERQPGKINLNSAPPMLIRDLLESRGYDEVIADEIIYLRDSRQGGFTSILDLRDIPDLNDEMLLQLADTFTTRSNVYAISSRGRSTISGIEVEIIAVVDRSTVPVRIIEYREQ